VSSAREHREVGSIREHRGSRQVWEAQEAYQERAKKTEQKGDTERGVGAVLLRSGGRITCRAREIVNVYILYIVYISDLGIGD